MTSPSTSAMTPQVKAQWLTALRSGDYDQTTEYLQRVDGGFCCLGVLCDLAERAGVVVSRTIVEPSCLPDAEGRETIEYRGSDVPADQSNDDLYDDDGYALTDRSYTGLPTAVQQWAGLSCGDPDVLDDDNTSGELLTMSLAGLNDGGKSFTYIADRIEQHL